jgi:hypothetical protein
MGAWSNPKRIDAKKNLGTIFFIGKRIAVNGHIVNKREGGRERWLKGRIVDVLFGHEE